MKEKKGELMKTHKVAPRKWRGNTYGKPTMKRWKTNGKSMERQREAKEKQRRNNEKQWETKEIAKETHRKQHGRK